MVSFLRVLLVIAIFNSFTPAFSHSGRTNSSGCHNVTATGGSHCHNGGSGRDGGDLLEALVVLGFIVYLVSRADRYGVAATDEDQVTPRGGFYVTYNPSSESLENRSDNFVEGFENGVSLGYRLRF